MARPRSGTARRRARCARSYRVREDRGTDSARSREAGGDCGQPGGSSLLDPARLVMRATNLSAADPARLLEFIDRFGTIRVAVFGDLIVDEFIYGDIARVS